MPESNHPLPPRLYQRLLGNAWHNLADPVRSFHASLPPVRAAGVFRVRHGDNWLARALAWLARLPRPGDSVDVQLLVTDLAMDACGVGEEWRRTFAGRPFVSQQYERSGRALVERVGLVELRFQLTVVEAALAYQSTGAALRLGGMRLPLPTWIVPRVTALEKALGETHRLEVAVEVRHPLLGRVVAYDGSLTRIETPV